MAIAGQRVRLGGVTRHQAGRTVRVECIYNVQITYRAITLCNALGHVQLKDVSW